MGLPRNVAQGGIEAFNMLPVDYARVAELNGRYADLPSDFADLSLVASGLISTVRAGTSGTGNGSPVIAHQITAELLGPPTYRGLAISSAPIHINGWMPASQKGRMAGLPLSGGVKHSRLRTHPGAGASTVTHQLQEGKQRRKGGV